MKNALKRMKIQQFFKKNRTAQNLYDKAMGAVDLGYGAGMGAASTALAPQLMAGQLSGSGLYTGTGIYTGQGIYTGSGEYVPNTNDLISSKSSMAIVPEFGRTDDDSIIITRREYVSEVFGPNYVSGGNSPGDPVLPFVIQSYPINPGLEGTFPWLSQIAQNYDEYEMLQCIFTFKSTTTESSLSLNGQVGTIIMATNYNAAAPNFQDKAEMQRYMGAVSSKLTETVLHGVECDPTKLSGSVGDYVRNNPVVSGQDVKTYDHGKFQIAVANCSGYFANVSLGELWVSYTVKLRKSKFYTALGLGITKDIFLSSGGETTALMIGSNLLSGQQNNLGSLLTAPTAQALKMLFPGSYRGFLKIQIAFSGSGAWGNTVPNVTPTGNVTPIQDLYGSNSSPIYWNGTIDPSGDSPTCGLWSTCTGSSQSTIVVLHVKLDISTNGIDNSITVSNLITPGVTIDQLYVDIAEYNSGFSGKALNINKSDAPVWVNSSKVIVANPSAA